MKARINLHISSFGITRYQRGEKSIAAHIGFRGNKMVYEVYYYDAAFERMARVKGMCCQPPTFARTEAGALRQINKFFNS